MANSVFVTKSFLPPFDEYIEYVKGIYERCHLTNQGPLLHEFESRLKLYLGSDYLHFVTNGTLALQIMLNAFGIRGGEVITTPFSYVATTTSILWEHCTPVFVDIEENNFCLDPLKIEECITDKTKAILGVHVFGYPCNIEKIKTIADKYKLKVFYDAAHAFGTKYKGKNLCEYGDASTLSLHATKLFHTIEGGAIIVNDFEINNKVDLLKRFGHHYDEHYMAGINAKASEFQAAMGLANWPYIGEIIARRKYLIELYDSILAGAVGRPRHVAELEYNYAYYPAVFPSETILLKVMDKLKQEAVFPRRYFYPSLNTLPYLENGKPCPVSESIASRILCLPLYYDLDEQKLKEIAMTVKKCLH